MAEFESAKQRLEAAVGRLEEMVARASETADGDGPAMAQENLALKEKLATLESALAESRGKAASLHEVVGTVSQRLDRTIEQLKTVLED